MNIKKGDIYGFLGENGAGKSTLFKILLDLIPEDSGVLERFGNEDKKNMDYFFKQTGSIIEHPYFYDTLSGRHNLNIHAKYMGFYSKNENTSRIEEVLAQVGLEYIDERAVKTYSLGMKQRLALARALLTKPQFLILDEPFNGLDPKGVVEIRNLLLNLNKVHGTTILISSHILSEIAILATTIGVIKNGIIIKEVPMDVVRNEEQQKIELEIDDSSKAAYLLEEELGIHGFKIVSDYTIEIYDITVDRGRLTKTMVLNGVNVNNIAIQSGTLEDYFLNLT
ncbi:hypothetical protein RV11_GL003157 [Enterococcus phoeniculicola]|nr:hypothetical protein RV11_GL003157 [Enterococcus phoeniculicola]